MNTNKHAHTHMHKHTYTPTLRARVLGSRLSRPGSPLAALSQLRSTDRDGWEGWVTEVQRVAGWGCGRGEMEKSSRGHLSQWTTCELFFFSQLCDPQILLHDWPRTMRVLEGALAPAQGQGDPIRTRLGKISITWGTLGGYNNKSALTLDIYFCIPPCW